MTGTSRPLHAVLPTGVDDPARPSGGNRYDRRALDGLRGRGRAVVEHGLAGAWPRPRPDDLARLDDTLARLGDDSLVLVDGLVATGAGSVLAAHGPRLRIVVLLHMPVGPDPSEAEALHAATAVVTTSAWSQARVRASYGLPRVEVCRPGTDPAPTARGSGVGGGTSFLCVAAVHPGKGHDVLLDALSHLGDRAWTLTCVGSLEVDPDHVAALQTQVYARSWERRVIFTGPLTGPALDAAYDASDLVVLPSRFESYGMVVAEATARGLPVVASAVGGVAEAFGGVPVGALPGLLVQPDDPAALTAALLAWLDDPALRERLGRAAEQRRASARGWDAVAADLDRVLTDVEACPRPGLHARTGGRR
jgi:glycosyltransferase involved in cell wall biosynthesis